MAEAKRQLQLLRFGDFEVDLRTGELRKAGLKLKFGGQPFQVLSILLERPGDLVTRGELQKRLWPDTFVDVDQNLNTAINKIREVLAIRQRVLDSSRRCLAAAIDLSVSSNLAHQMRLHADPMATGTPVKCGWRPQRLLQRRPAM